MSGSLVRVRLMWANASSASGLWRRATSVVRALTMTVIAATIPSAPWADWTLAPEPDRGGISFPNFLPDPAAIPVLGGLGPVGAGMHTRDEYVELKPLRRRIRLLAGLLVQV